MNFTPLEDALAHLTCATRYGFLPDDITREHVEAALAIVHQLCYPPREDHTRAGNLSPAYLLAQDQQRRRAERGA